MRTFFVYSRDAPAVASLREDVELLEEHWSYMDAFAASMIARGPTFAPDRETVTGSLHVLELPSVEAAHTFVAGEPNNRAGVYADHAVWRFENVLGRTMWEFSSPEDEPRFLIIARGAGDRTRTPESLAPELRDRLILYGVLSSLEEGNPIGVALAVQAGKRSAIDALIRDGRLGLRDDELEIHDWEFGGRR